MDQYTRQQIHHLEPRHATGHEITLIHDADYVERVAVTSSQPSFAFDADTSVSSQSYETALLAAGGFLSLLDAIMASEVDNGFALVRPPGHHAERDRAMGFCLFNNVAIGAEYLRSRYELERVLIVDWDVHHGNGTQHSFTEDSGVLYVSAHQHPHYPGTGSVHEVGRGDGKGATVNLPLAAGCGDAEYLGVFERVIAPIARQFEPQFVLVSAGFDAHGQDPLAGMRVTTEGFGHMTRTLLRTASDCADGRCAAVLEGGYDLAALGTSVVRVLDELGGEGMSDPPPELTGPTDLEKWLISVHGSHWDLPDA
jgi:acetoin utilization deacetylase AcuC-like enzyme